MGQFLFFTLIVQKRSLEDPSGKSSKKRKLNRKTDSVFQITKDSEEHAEKTKLERPVSELSLGFVIKDLLCLQMYNFI